MYPDISDIESQYEPSWVDLDALPVPQNLEEPNIHTAPLPTRTRSKRAPSGLYHLVFGRRAQRSPSPQPQSLDISDQTNTQRLHDLLVKMRLWEAALLIHFRDRFQQTPEALATDPMWAKLIQVRSAIKVLVQEIAQRQSIEGVRLMEREGELGINRMKK